MKEQQENIKVEEKKGDSEIKRLKFIIRKLWMEQNRFVHIGNPSPVNQLPLEERWQNFKTENNL